MNARNKLKICDLMGIDTHIVYHAHRMNREWGWGLFKNQTVVGVVRVVKPNYPNKFQLLLQWCLFKNRR